MLRGLSSYRTLLTFKPMLNLDLSVGLNLSLYPGSFCSLIEMAHSPGYTDLSVSYHCVTNDLTIQGTWEEGVISLIGLRGVWTVLLQAESLKATWGSHFYQGRLFSWWRQKCRRVGQKEMRGKLRMGVITSYVTMAKPSIRAARKQFASSERNFRVNSKGMWAPGGDGGHRLP